MKIDASNILILVVTMLYASQGVWCLVRSQHFGAIVWLGYAAANIGIMGMSK